MLAAMTDEETDFRELPLAELYSRLDLGLATLRTLALERDEGARDAELNGRFAALFELLNSGSLGTPAPGGKIRHMTAKQLVRACDKLSAQVAAAKALWPP